MTLPSKDSFATYGGVKFDFIDVVDPTTDRSATEMNVALASLSMMTRTCPKAIIQIDGYASGPNVIYHESLWGNSSDLTPVVARTTTGTYTITWPSTVTDPLDEDHSLSLKTGWGNCSLAATIVSVAMTSTNVVTVTTSNAAGSLVDVGTSYRIDVFVQ